MKTTNKESETIQFLPGYGIFPYVIIRIFSAIYLQVPIQLFCNIEEQNHKDYPGFHAYKIPDEILALPRKEMIRALKDDLIEMLWQMQQQIRIDKGNAPKMCLVLDKDWCFYLNNDELIESTSIPSGGSLITQSHQGITMNTQHYREVQVNH